MLRVLRDVIGNRPLVGFGGRRARFELIGYVVTWAMWHVEKGSRHGGFFLCCVALDSAGWTPARVFTSERCALTTMVGAVIGYVCTAANVVGTGI